MLLIACQINNLRKQTIMKRTFYRILFCLFCTSIFPTTSLATTIADFNVVPKPNVVNIDKKKEGFDLSKNFVIYVAKNNDDMVRNASFLQQYIEDNIGVKIEVSFVKTKNKPRIVLSLNADINGNESYRILSSKNEIKIEGKTPQGVFYGIQTLRKSIPLDKGRDIIIPNAYVESSPRFSYRGYLLDVSRHFFDVKTIKNFIDMLALHNINTFHWHLTDDQGWRIQINKYPKLTEIGAYRDGTVIGRNSGLYDNVRYGGFYTQEECRDIVEYARQRYINIIPEIDMPGHMIAAMTAYPYLGCTEGPYRVERMWGVFDDILCAGKEETFTFIEDVLDEIMQIFPSKIIHIGGDEAPRTRWKVCPKCQERIKNENIKADAKHSAEDKLQSYFTKRVENYLNQHGRSIIGWDEILDGEINPSASIMSWRGVEAGLNAAEVGHDVVMSPNATLYFDHYQTPATDWINPTLIGGFSPLEKVYNFEPIPTEISDKAKKHIIGVQANLWTEYIAFSELLFYQTLPRIAALSEIQWLNPKDKNFDNFLNRLSNLLPLYKCYGWPYCNPKANQNNT